MTRLIAARPVLAAQRVAASGIRKIPKRRKNLLSCCSPASLSNVQALIVCGAIRNFDTRQALHALNAISEVPL